MYFPTRLLDVTVVISTFGCCNNNCSRVPPANPEPPIIATLMINQEFFFFINLNKLFVKDILNPEFFFFMDLNKIFIAIGTQNSAKIQAVIDAFEFLYKDSNINFEVKPLKIDSGVGAQPIGLENIIKGAINRAKLSFEIAFQNISTSLNQCFGIGIEAGLAPIAYAISRYMDFQFVAIYHDEKITLGCGSAFEYPKLVIENLFAGKSKEIGEVFEKLSGIPSIKEKEGAVGFLSQGKITRSQILKNGVIMALLPIINSNLYFA